MSKMFKGGIENKDNRAIFYAPAYELDDVMTIYVSCKCDTPEEAFKYLSLVSENKNIDIDMLFIACIEEKKDNSEEYEILGSYKREYSISNTN